MAATAPVIPLDANANVPAHLRHPYHDTPWSWSFLLPWVHVPLALKSHEQRRTHQQEQALFDRFNKSPVTRIGLTALGIIVALVTLPLVDSIVTVAKEGSIGATWLPLWFLFRQLQYFVVALVSICCGLLAVMLLWMIALLSAFVPIIRVFVAWVFAFSLVMQLACWIQFYALPDNWNCLTCDTWTLPLAW